jgi:predicted nucleic acid-binding protein
MKDLLKPASIIVLDNEAIQALSNQSHPKHRRLLALIERYRQHLEQGSRASLIVPTTVRVEAMINRQEPKASFVNRIVNQDHLLNSKYADRAVELRNDFSFLSVADAHIAAIATLSDAEVVIITSDVKDFRNSLSTENVNIVHI